MADSAPAAIAAWPRKWGPPLSAVAETAFDIWSVAASRSIVNGAARLTPINESGR
jgi:hypothetical protein